MGTWGTALYSDDMARDIRDDYKDLLGDGVLEPEATQLLLEQWKNDLSDPDMASVFWLTLADVQWNLGRLQDRVKQEALLVIDSGSDLPRWLPDQKLVAKRKVVLERLKSKLQTAPPPAKKVNKRYVDSTAWELGDVYGLRLRSGNLALLHVIGFHDDKGGRAPVCELLDWAGETAPAKEALEKMPYWSAKVPPLHLRQFLFGSLSAKDLPRERVAQVAKAVEPKQECGGYGVIFWRSVDEQLEQLFDLS